MGNSSSSGRGHHEESVDYGYLSPQGIYTTPKDFNQAVVSQLICARRLAPFYRPLEDYDESWDYEQILAARKELHDPEGTSESSTTRTEGTASNTSKSAQSTQSKRFSPQKELIKVEAAVYIGAVECPICFLYYPPNINHSRCCDQAICTECFVQIKRTEPTTTHLVSEPAACPYCVQENFGVVYTPPVWRAGIGSEASSLWSDPPKGPQSSGDISTPFPTHKRRQKSYGHESPEVVTTDQIRPDWEAKLAAVRAAVTRRANRRIIMRQVGDRLIPVGVTSGRVHAIAPEEVQTEGNDSGGSRRSRRRQHQNQEFNQILGSMGLPGQDLEELMIMEAMRLSLLDHEEHLRREAQNRNESRGATAEAEPTYSSFLAVPGEMSGSSNQGTYLGDPTPTSSAPVSTTTSTSSSLSSDEAHNHQEHGSIPAAVPVPQSISMSLPPAHPIATLQGMNNTTPSWRRRTSSPPPFATLSALMGAAATATAVLGNGDTTENAPPHPRDPSTHVDGGLSDISAGSAPIITVDESMTRLDTEAVITSADPELSPQLAKQDSTSSSTELSGAVEGPGSSLPPFSSNTTVSRAVLLDTNHTNGSD